MIHERKPKAGTKTAVTLFFVLLALAVSGSTTAERDERELRLAAEQGDAEAQTDLGLMYSWGEDVPQDHAEAIKWFRMAAEQGYARAQHNLAVSYYNGEGVPQDRAEAVKWFRLAAEQGEARAQYNLAVSYYNGEGVPQDRAEAVKWFRLAAEQGDAKAQSDLGMMYALGEGVPQDYAETMKWYRLAAEQGYARAQLILGWMYDLGEGVPQNRSEAAKWYRMASEQGMVKIPAGSYKRGSPISEEERQEDETHHTVTISRPFLMAKTEVTQAQWTRVMGSNPSYFKGDDLPVEQVSWLDAVAFCNKLSELEGLNPAYDIQGRDVTWDRTANGYRLPTEAEWEYACRAGTTTRYHTGNSEADLDRAGWYTGNSGRKAHPVGLKEANAWGLYDMHGNVAEWCWDRYGSYPSGRVSDPAGLSTGAFRVIRGGSWGSYARICRSALRVNYLPGVEGDVLGFRPVRSVF